VLAWWHNPYARFSLISLLVVLVAGVAALVANWPGWLVVLIVVLVVNVITLVMYRYDKSIAGSERVRVPESVLLALALFGGSPAAYFAIYRFHNRHKVEKKLFVTLFWAIVVLQVVVIVVWGISRFQAMSQ
jgi:uncharacterized membrane protein YsdA (DUF1294 family)